MRSIVRPLLFVAIASQLKLHHQIARSASLSLAGEGQWRAALIRRRHARKCSNEMQRSGEPGALRKRLAAARNKRMASSSSTCVFAQVCRMKDQSKKHTSEVDLCFSPLSGGVQMHHMRTCARAKVVCLKAPTSRLEGLVAAACSQGGDNSGERPPVFSSAAAASHSRSTVSLCLCSVLRTTRPAPSRTDKKPSRSIHKALVVPMGLFGLHERPDFAVRVVGTRLLVGPFAVLVAVRAVRAVWAVRAVRVVLARASVLLVLGAERRRRFIARDAYVSNMLTA